MSPAPNIEMMAAQPLPDIATDGDVPDWVHLLPAGQVSTFDNRGPYDVIDPQAVIDASFSARGDIEIDENHATFLAAPKGGEAPARGWIVEMQAREDGIWGRVKWTDEGRRLVESLSYRRISPVLKFVTKGGRKVVSSILNVSLVNRNNLRGLVALNQQQENDMDFMAKLAEMLGLDAGADEAAITAAIEALKEPDADEAAMQSQLVEIGKALGCDDGADATVVLNAAKAAAVARGDEATIVALQAEVVDLGTKVKTLTEGNAKTAAETFVDTAIREGRVGVKPQRDRFIAMHMRDAAEAEAVINGLPKLGSTPTSLEPPAPKDGSVALNAEQIKVARMLGQDPKVYAATLEAERAAEQETL